MRADLGENDVGRGGQTRGQRLKLSCFEQAQWHVQRARQINDRRFIRFQRDRVDGLHGLRRNTSLRQHLSDQCSHLGRVTIARTAQTQSQALRRELQMIHPQIKLRLYRAG